MLRRKKNKEENGGGRRGGGPLARLFLWGSLLVLVVLAIAGAALVYLQQQGERAAAETRARLLAEEKAGRVAQAVAFYRHAGEQLAGSPRIAALLAESDPEQLADEERRLREALPQLKRVHLLPAVTDEVALREERRFSYAALDMWRRAAAGEKPGAEIHAFASARGHAALAFPVTDDEDRRLGVLMLEISLDPLEKLGRESVPGGERFEFLQVSDGQALKFAGDAGSDRHGTVPVPGTIWQVGYALPAVEARLESLLGPAAALLVAWLLIALVLHLLARGVARGLAADGEQLADSIRAALGGRRIGSLTARVAELQPVFDALAPVGGARPTRAAEAVPEKTPAEASDSNGPAAGETGQAEPASEAALAFPRTLFRQDEIGGVFGEEFTEAQAREVGRAIGSEAEARGQQTVIVGRDGRASSPQISAALCRGLETSGRDVVDIGLVPSPVLYFATAFLGADSAVMVSGSGTDPNHNGLKVILAGERLQGEGIRALKTRLDDGDLVEGAGVVQQQNLVPDYLERIAGDIQVVRKLRLVIDCGNGAAGRVAPDLFRLLGCEVSALYCEIDGTFPHHAPDPTEPGNLEALVAEVERQQADLGIAFDVDGDSLGVVSGSGQVVPTDRLLMLLARDVLSRQPGADVVYDVNASRHLSREILVHGGRPVMWKSGHRRVAEKMKETGALLAGELGGHIFFKERWYGFEDALYAAARLLEVLSLESVSPDEVFAGLPQSVATPELEMDIDRTRIPSVMRRLSQDLGFEGAKIVDVDGVRAEFEDGWGLVRPAEAEGMLRFRFEAGDEAAMEKIQTLFREELDRICPGRAIPF